MPATAEFGLNDPAVETFGENDPKVDQSFGLNDPAPSVSWGLNDPAPAAPRARVRAALAGQLATAREEGRQAEITIGGINSLEYLTGTATGPIVPIPKTTGAEIRQAYPNLPGPVADLVAGVQQGAAGVVESVETPLNLAAMGAGAVAPTIGRVVAGTFAVKTAESLPEQARQLGASIGEGNVEKATAAAIGTAASGLVLAPLARHAIYGTPKPAAAAPAAEVVAPLTAQAVSELPPVIAEVKAPETPKTPEAIPEDVGAVLLDAHDLAATKVNSLQGFTDTEREIIQGKLEDWVRVEAEKYKAANGTLDGFSPRTVIDTRTPTAIDFVRAEKRGGGASSVQLDQPAGEGGTVGEAVPSGEATPAEAMQRGEFINTFSRAVDTLSPEDQAAVRGSLAEGGHDLEPAIAQRLKTALQQTGITPDFSVGPGAMSPSDAPGTPPAARAAGAAVEQAPEQARPLGIVSGVGMAMRRIASEAGLVAQGVMGRSMPRTTAANRTVGEAGVRYAASRESAAPQAATFAVGALEGTKVDPVKFGAALTEDNLRSVRESLRQKATDLLADGKEEESAAATEAADQVSSLIGSKDSPFKTEDEYQDFLADPATKKAVGQHIQLWQEIIDPQFKAAMSLDPEIELPTRGLQTGARVNLKAVLEGEAAAKPVTGNSPSLTGTSPSLTGTFKRKSIFGTRAKGTGQAYEVSYPEIIHNTFARQLEIANKNIFDKAMVEAGLAEIHKPGWQGTIGGEAVRAFPLKRGPGASNIYVKRSLGREYEAAANVGTRFSPLPGTSLLNRSALAGLTDFTVHTSNLMTALFNRPSSGKLFADTLLSATGRADVPITLARAILKAQKDNTAQISELATIGAGREASHAGGALGFTGRILKSIDKATRLVLDDTFTQLAKDGLVEDTETNRREYVNQVGQYNRRLQGPLTRFLRDTGFGPFVTAGKTFNSLGVKMITLSPGLKASSPAAAAALRANVLAKWGGGAVLAGSLNYLLTAGKGGGVMGRPGTPLGKIDTGLDDKNGKALQFPLFDVLGLGRGMRVTGLRGAVEAKRLGLTDGDAIDSAARDVLNSWIGPAAGPPVQFGMVAGTGFPPAVSVGRASPVAPPGQSQAMVNIGEALKEANPIASSIFDIREGKSPQEALARQLPRLTLVPGKQAQMVAQYPRIVGLAQTHAYADYVVNAARKLAPDQRAKFIEEKLAPLNGEQRRMVNDALKRRKVR